MRRHQRRGSGGNSRAIATVATVCGKKKRGRKCNLEELFFLLLFLRVVASVFTLLLVVTRLLSVPNIVLCRSFVTTHLTS